MQKYVCQPNEKGHLLPYCVAVFNTQKNEYVPLRGKEYSTYEEACRRAAEMNKNNQQGCDDIAEDNELSPATEQIIAALEGKWEEIDNRK